MPTTSASAKKKPSKGASTSSANPRTPTKSKSSPSPTEPLAAINGIPVHCAHDAIVECEKLVPNPRNPNTHSIRQLDLLEKIIRAQGWRAGITVSNRSGFIVAGHARHTVAQRLGDCAPVDYQDFATEAEETAHLLADNRIAELAEIDGALVLDLISDFPEDFDLDLTGFDADGLKKIYPSEPPDFSDDPRLGNRFEIIVECDDEQSQRAVFEKLEGEGYRCRTLTL